MKIANGIPFEIKGQRVWRVYQGGKLLDRLHGRQDPMDGHFPEEWIMSTVKARNLGREQFKNEGLCTMVNDENITLKSIIDSSPINYLGNDHVIKYGNQTGVLLKLIDSSERLTVQVHPDRDKAMELLNSFYGKTECWHIVGERNINGEDPYVYLGFKEGVTKEYWRKLFNEQDIKGILKCLHKFRVKTGDTILIEGGVPHAIGAGCFMFEIQEPTDYTMRVERTTPLGFKVDDNMCHQGLGYDKMFDCFHYDCLSKEETYDKWFINPKVTQENTNGKITDLLNYDNTEYFKMKMLEIYDRVFIDLEPVYSGLYILEGRGTIVANGQEEIIEPCKQYFIPAGTSQYELKAITPIKALQFFGPKVN